VATKALDPAADKAALHAESDSPRADWKPWSNIVSARSAISTASLATCNGPAVARWSASTSRRSDSKRRFSAISGNSDDSSRSRRSAMTSAKSFASSSTARRRSADVFVAQKMISSAVRRTERYLGSSRFCVLKAIERTTSAANAAINAFALPEPGTASPAPNKSRRSFAVSRSLDRFDGSRDAWTRRSVSVKLIVPNFGTRHCSRGFPSPQLYIFVGK